METSKIPKLIGTKFFIRKKLQFRKTQRWDPLRLKNAFLENQKQEKPKGPFGELKKVSRKSSTVPGKTQKGTI